MKRAIRTLGRLYGRLLGLYPRSHRQQYRSEMRSVFELAAEAADRRGLLSLLKLCLRELCSLPGAVAQEHWYGARRKVEDTIMTEWPENGHVPDNSRDAPDALPGSWADRSCAWGETLAGLVPFLFIGLWSTVLALLTFPPPPWQLIAYVGPLVAGYVIALIGLGVGWTRGFPRWSYAYVLCVPLFGLYVSLAAYNTILPYAYVLCVPGLFSSLIPLAVMAIIVLAVTRSPRPLAWLFTNVWRDWTLLSFALYGLVPMFMWLAFDEVEDSFALPFMIVLTLILAGGALAYLRCARAWQRVTALLVGTILARALETAGTRVYWSTHPEPWMTVSPIRWYDIVRASATGGALLLAFLFAPALLGLLRRWVDSPRAA